jgi:hypothetical protein
MNDVSFIVAIAVVLVAVAVTGAMGQDGRGAVSENEEDNVLHVYIVAHSHCDPGWLSTFEGYYESDVTHVRDI